MKPARSLRERWIVSREEPSIQSEILRMVESKNRKVRDTVPAPRSVEEMPPSRELARGEEQAYDTIPAPPPSGADVKDEHAGEEKPPSTIPGPPKVPVIVEV
jgi:hypothetical protein